MKRQIYIVAFIGLTFLTSCGKTENKVPPVGNPVKVTVSHTGENADASLIQASGKLVAKNAVNISTRVMGYITHLNAQVGQNITAGQLLVEINSSDIRAKSGQADAQILQAQANFNNAKKDYQRFQNLFKENSASQKELDDTHTRFEMAKAALESARQMKNEASSQFQYTRITAPISGTVTAKFADQGDLANPGMPILTIESPSQLQAELLVSGQNIDLIKQGQQVQILVKSVNKSVSGVVSEIGKSAVGGQYVVKVNLSQSSGLLPGMFVNGQFPVKSLANLNQPLQNRITIPQSALVQNGQLTGVYVVSSENTAILRWLKVGKIVGGQVEVLAGLRPADTYISSSQGRLYNGVKVIVQ